jgi:predicted transcriptional regulator
MRVRKVIEEVCGILSIPPVGRQILVVLSSARQGMFVKEIAEKTRRSERAVKLHLRRLHQQGFILRRRVRTRAGRHAHLYSFPGIGRFIRSARLELLRRARGLRALEA